MSRCTIFFILTLTAFMFLQCDRSSTDSNQDKAISAKQIIQLTIREPSGLTHDSRIGNLYTVRDGNSGRIYAMSTNGRLLKEIKTNSKDLEGIAINSTNDTLYVVEEQTRIISKYTLTGKITDQIQIPLNLSGPNGPEGIAIHPVTKHIFVVNQKNPKLLIELTPMGKLVASNLINFADQLSGLCFNPTSYNLMLVSHKSQSLYEIDLSGKKLRSWKIPVEKAEGVAMDKDGMVYVVCDQTSQLYTFELN